MEWNAIYDLIKQRKNDTVMLCRFERATAEGLYSMAGFLDLDDRSEEETAARILQRLALNEGRKKSYYLELPGKAAGEQEHSDVAQHTEHLDRAETSVGLGLDVFNFAAQLEEKRHNFVGRKWLFDKVADWLARANEAALLITGDPGIGKSAFVAELIDRNPGKRILAYHICRADDPQTVEPSVFIRSLAGMIAQELPTFANLIAERRYRLLFDPETIDDKPALVFDQGIIGALREIPAPAITPRCIIIDGLDEALVSTPTEPRIPTLLSLRTDRFPSWCRIIATARNDAEVLSRLSALRAHRIEARREQNLQDLDAFITSRLNTPKFAEILSCGATQSDTVKSKVLVSADGNFLYASQALNDIERGRQSVQRLNELPNGIHGIYLSFFERAFPHPASFGKCRQFLEVILAAQQPIPLKSIPRADHQ